MEPNISLTSDMQAKSNDEIIEMQNIPHLIAIHSIMYLTTTTHPDIAFMVVVLGHFNHNPGPCHWHAVKQLLHYPKGTMDYKIVYGPDHGGHDLFTTYTDADHRGNKDNGHSTSSYVICIRGP